MIVIKDSSKKYGDKIQFQNLNQEFLDGKIYAIVGVNGIGKTTLLNMITQANFIDNGEILIDTIKNTNFKSKYNYFYIPDRKDLFLNLTGMEYLSFICKIYNKNFDKSFDKLKELSFLFKMEEELNKLIRTYSLGMKQKIYIIAALISDAKNLILDEPFNGLDPEMSYVFKKILCEYKLENKLILYTVHNIEMLLNFCDHVLFIDKNRCLLLAENTGDIKSIENIFFNQCIIDIKNNKNTRNEIKCGKY